MLAVVDNSRMESVVEASLRLRRAGFSPNIVLKTIKYGSSFDSLREVINTRDKERAERRAKVYGNPT